MLSLQVIVTVKIAVEICNDSELKRNILFPPDFANKQSNQYDCKQQWDEIVERKAVTALKNLGFPKELQTRVMEVVFAIGMRMLTWAEYHEGTLGFSREYSIEFLNSSFFTQQGLLDNKKGAEKSMSDKNLRIEQKYKIACLYCFTDHISALYKQLSKEDKENFCRPQWIKQPKLVRFWSYYLMGEVDKIKGGKSLDQYRLEKAVKSGNKAAVEYCLFKTNLRRKKGAVVDAAMEAVRNRIISRDDWIVFRDRRYDGGKETWVPSDYYVDIVAFLLSKMKEDQQIEFLKKDIEGVKYKRKFFEDHNQSNVLEYFLNWPYQNYFMETAGLMWEFLPEHNYAVLLLKVCNRIEPEKEKNLKYAEEKRYDYRVLLKEFWYQSPQRYKIYVLSNHEIVYRTDTVIKVKAGVGLIAKLLTLKDFTNEDRKNIKLILASATDKEKENIFSSKEWRGICTGLMKEEEWKILDRFGESCFSSKEEADKFKKKLIFTKEAQRIFIDFVKNDKWSVAESLIEWSSLPEEEVKQLKKEMICSYDGRKTCVDLISYHTKVEEADKFVRWCFSSEEANAFKKELVFSNHGICKCAGLVIENQLELVSEFINFGLSTEEEIKELKKIVAYRMGRLVCEELISGCSVEDKYDDRSTYKIGRITEFEGGKWEEVEKFLTWCFSSENEISEFKRKIIFEESGTDIHLSLIDDNKWEEAEIFFVWLGLSIEDIRKLKKETLLSELGMEEIYESLHDSNPRNFSDYAWGKWEKVELYLRWCLMDKEAVFEFKDKFDEKYGFKKYENDGKEVPENKGIILKVFYSVIEEILNNLSRNEEGTKRQCEILAKEFPNKRICDINPGQKAEG